MKNKLKLLTYEGSIVVLEIGKWAFGQNTVGHGGQLGQVTRCRWNNNIFYVRENITGINSFNISSGERWGDKQGLSPVRMSRQTLELLVENEQLWETIARVVREADTLRRPVLHNVTFTKRWIADKVIMRVV